MENKIKYFSTAIIATLLFFASFASAQQQGDLDAACAQAMQAPADPPQAREMACSTVSANVSAQSPPGIALSCVWTGSNCIAHIVVSDSVKDPGTESTDLKSACAKGGGSQSVCNSITAGIASAGQSPSGITIECVWNNPGASNPCSPRITLQTSTITSKMVGSFIKSMEFIQGGVATTSVKVMSDPFVPYVIHTVVDGSSFPGGKDSDTWMTVTATKDVTPQTFDMDSIDPAAMAAAEQNKLKNQFTGDGPTEIGPGVGPDFTALKALQTFNWSMTLPYDTGKTYAGTAQCNGTFNETLDKCMNASSEANWIKMPLCTNPASCPSGSYLKDVPSAGYLTIFNADPVPVYRTSGTTTTSTTSTTTTTSTTASTTTTTTSTSTTTTTLFSFYDGFEGGLVNWATFGSPVPVVHSEVAGRYYVFDNNGDSWCHSGAVSVRNFSLPESFVYQSEVYLNITNPDGCWADASIVILLNNTPAGMDTSCPTIDYPAGLSLNLGFSCWHDKSAAKSITVDASLYNENGSTEGASKTDMDINYIGGWHRLKIVVVKRMVRFYLDDDLIYSSVKKLHPAVLDGRKLYLGYRSSGSAGKAYHDYVSLNETLSDVSGDANGDGQVDYKDLLILASTYGKQLGNSGYDARGDFTGDNKVDYKDLLLLASNYGH